MSAVDIFVATNSVPRAGVNAPFKHNRKWQYHPRSDRHSQTACWAIMFDLLQHCSLLRTHVASGKVGFGINHAVLNVSTGKSKDLDLVIQRINTENPQQEITHGPANFVELGDYLDMKLTSKERSILHTLPDVKLLKLPDAPLLLALETKATMTEHSKARPRLFDEFNSSHSLVHGSTDSAISAGWSIINTSPTFVSPLRNSFPFGALPEDITIHKKESAEKLARALTRLPIATSTNRMGFDALGFTMVSCANDGTPVTKDSTSYVPRGMDYSYFLTNLEQLYSTRFSHI